MASVACPACGNNKTNVTSTRGDTRLRKCPACGHNFKTLKNSDSLAAETIESIFKEIDVPIHPATLEKLNRVSSYDEVRRYIKHAGALIAAYEQQHNTRVYDHMAFTIAAIFNHTPIPYNALFPPNGNGNGHGQPSPEPAKPTTIDIGANKWHELKARLSNIMSQDAHTTAFADARGEFFMGGLLVVSVGNEFKRSLIMERYHGRMLEHGAGAGVTKIEVVVR